MPPVSPHMRLFLHPPFGRPSFETCSICLSVLHNERWLEADEAIRALRTFERRSVPHLKDGLCDRCETDVRRRRLRVPEQAAA
jgi:hypothetical protein